MELEDHIKFTKSKNYVLIGNEDEYYSPSILEEHVAQLKNKCIKFELIKSFQAISICNSAGVRRNIAKNFVSPCRDELPSR